VFPYGKRKKESVDDGHGLRGSSTSSRSTSFGRPSTVAGEGSGRKDARFTAKIKERQLEQNNTWRRSRSRSNSIPTRARPDACAAQAQQQLPVVAIPRSTVSVDDGRPLHEQDNAESFEEAQQRRREIQRMREEARREMDKVVQTVFFNDPYISPLDVFKP
jgi:hypothetical protein